MNIITDENVSRYIIEQLRATGHHVTRFIELGPRGSFDPIVLAMPPKETLSLSRMTRTLENLSIISGLLTQGSCSSD